MTLAPVFRSTSPLPAAPHARRARARRPARGGTVCAALLALLLGGAADAQQPFDVSLRDGRLSIHANGVPISDLAEALSAETGVSFVVTGDTEMPITTEIVDEPFARAVAKLFPNHLLVRDGKSADAAVIEVVLMLDDISGGGTGAGGDGEFLPSGAPADEVVGSEGEEALLIDPQNGETLESFEQSIDATESEFDASADEQQFDPETGEPLPAGEPSATQ